MSFTTGSKRSPCSSTRSSTSDDSNDSDSDAKSFLRQYPVSYPSYSDGNLAIAAVFKGVQAFPTTAFYDRRGALSFVHQGAYQSEQALAKDIKRYAG